ncbi:MAG: hypothetical protein ACYCSO_05300 [Cuniculiplasma sp.]
MRIEMVCPNGHRASATDMRVYRSREEILNAWKKMEVHCVKCDELYTDIHEVLEVVLRGVPYEQ